MILRGSGKNPLLAFGLLLFMITFSFVLYNAFFRQPAVHRSVFFSTHADLEHRDVSSPQNSVSSIRKKDVQGGNAGYPAAAVSDSDGNLKILQQKLTALGLYDGKIDGLSGPQTVEAIKRWEQLQKDLIHHKAGSAEAADSIAAVIRNQGGGN